MKIDKPGKSGRIERAAPYSANTGAPRDTAIAAVLPSAAATVLGIPEAEFTPKVSNAIMMLMREVDRLQSELKEAQDRLDSLKRQADQDILLPVLNRRAFVREITRFIAFAARHGTPSSLLYFDLNHFKTVNDEFGHAAGDRALAHFVELLASQIRETDVLARLGGDEFGIILAHVHRDQAQLKATRLADTIRERPLIWEGHEIRLDCAVGTIELHAGLTAETAMKDVDAAMYAQKRGT